MSYIKPLPELHLDLNQTLNVYKLNADDYDYIYSNLYHMIHDFEIVHNFLLRKDQLYRKRSRDDKMNFFNNLYRSIKKIKTPSII